MRTFRIDYIGRASVMVAMLVGLVAGTFVAAQEVQPTTQQLRDLRTLLAR